MATKKKTPTRSGARYTVDEIRESLRFKKLKTAIPHVPDNSIIEIVRRDITSEWEKVRQAKVQVALTQFFAALKANGYDENQYMIKISDGVPALSKMPDKFQAHYARKHPRRRARDPNGTPQQVLKDAAKKPTKRAC